VPSFKQSRDNLEWRKCVSLKGYEVSEYGHLRRLVETTHHNLRYPKGHEYKYGLAGKGYAYYNIGVGSGRKNFYAHRLVAEAFLGEQPSGTEVAHNDGDKLNCHYSNLRYATPRENNMDKIAHGTHPGGDNHPQVKIKASEAENIFKLRRLGYSQQKIADLYNVTQTTIGDCIRRFSAEPITR